MKNDLADQNIRKNENHLFHILDTCVFETGMKIFAARGKIRTRQTFKRQSCAVCTAADGLDDGSDAAIQHSLFCQIDDFHMGFDLRDHIIILIRQFQFNAVVVFFVFLVYDGLDQFFLFSKEVLSKSRMM